MIRRIGRPGLLATAARTAVIAGTAQATAGAVASRQHARAQQAQAAAAPPPQVVAAPPVQAAPQPPAPSGAGDLIAQLERLAQLQSAGVLSAEEFAAAKAKLLS
ncbi:SHOCT domain-containing protein [Tessaracoccus palaemonis]|uniref:SHOCT domain-containing protein n=1 Tax=Tessaracoccus palaemonis TaxID=2829499 RepID=A0ABX8SHX5_9ACTN|nr:SHOCT domain-containing protein [Tessaracoccus palaemonis]QXT62479.1 SHOCT domain-containing protein [Tessaracoccus palaemonis]